MDLTKICNQYLDNINWNNAEHCDFTLKETAVDVWKINIETHLPVINYFISVLQPDEITRANKFHQLRDKNRAIISRGALRYILAGYLAQQPKDIAIGATKNKKPYVLSQTGLHFNISHSGNWIIIAFSTTELGADVEFMDDGFGYNDVLKDNFSTAEIDYICESSSIERFFKTWTRKEALTKASGKGLEEDLKLIPGLDGIQYAESKIISTLSDILTSTFKLTDHYMASISCNIQTNEIRFWEINF